MERLLIIDSEGPSLGDPEQGLGAVGVDRIVSTYQVWCGSVCLAAHFVSMQILSVPMPKQGKWALAIPARGTLETVA